MAQSAVDEGEPTNAEKVGGFVLRDPARIHQGDEALGERVHSDEERPRRLGRVAAATASEEALIGPLESAA